MRMTKVAHRMSVAIAPAYFSDKLVPGERSAKASVGGCNFRCQFCGVRGVPFFAEDSMPEKTDKEIVAEMHTALGGHKSLKIGASGEPTIRPAQLRFLAETAKAEGAYVIVDTNGSRPDIIFPLVEEGVVDQVEVGLKGFTGEEAAILSGTNDLGLAWDNPVYLIRKLVREHPSVHVFPTFVVDADTSREDISGVFSLFSPIVSSMLYMRFDAMVDPITDQVVAAMCDYVLNRPVLGGSVKYRIGPTLKDFEDKFSGFLFENLTGDDLIIPGLDVLVRRCLRNTFYSGFDFKPPDASEMVAMIAGVARAYPEFENRVIVVSKPSAKYDEEGLVRLWLENPGNVSR